MEGDNDMLKKETYLNHILFTATITIMIFIGSIAMVNAAETDPTDIDSGIYDGVPWRITADYELLIGEEGKEYAYSYNAFSSRNENSWPWSGYPTGDRIKEVRVLGTVHGCGSLRGMFNEFPNCVSIDIRNLDTSETTDMGLMFSSCYHLQDLDVSGFSTANVKNMRYMFCQCKSLTSLDVSGFDTSNVTDMWAMFSNCQSLTGVDVSGFDTGKVKNMGGMFLSCKVLTSIDTSGFDTSNVTDMSEMFATCSSLASVDVSGFDTGKVTDMYHMFYQCKLLTEIDLSGFDTGNVTNMNAMFYGCESLISIDLSGFDWGNAEYIATMFQGCTSLTNVDISGFDAGKAVNMPSMFSGCESLINVDMSGFNAGNITDLSSMFSGCKSLTTVNLPGVNTSGVQHIEWMFKGCKSLTSIDLSELDTGSVTNMRGMFYGCESLTSIDLSELDTGNVTDMSGMFEGCSSLTSIDLSELDTGKVTDTSSMFKDCSALTTIVRPDSLKRLGYNMFGGCSSLEEVEISNLDRWCSIQFFNDTGNPLNASPNAVLLINGGTGSKVTLDEGITNIPSRTFNGWKYLKEVTLPASLTKIGAGAFEGTSSLSTVNVDSLNQWLNMDLATETSSPLAGGKAELRIRSGQDYDALPPDVVIDKSIGTIPAYAFSGCRSIRSVVIPDSVTGIGTGAFAGCEMLSGIAIPDSVSALPERAFADCRNLEKVLVPDSVTSIDLTAFRGCSEDLVLYGTPGSAAEAFASQKGLKFLDYSEYDAMEAGAIGDDIRWVLTGGSQLTIEGAGEDVTLGAAAFENIRDKVTNVKVKGISRIEAGAFSSLSSLERVTIDINTKIKGIAPEAFAGNDVEVCCYSNSYDAVARDLPGFTVKKLSGSRAGNVTWTYNDNTGTLLLSSGSTEFGETFTESPFRDLNVRRVEFSDSFACKALPANLFAGCSSITEVKLAARTTGIGENVFRDCTNLRRVTWHDGITAIGENAFENCTNLRQVLLADSVLVNEKDQEMEDVTVEIPAGVKVIPRNAFRNCRSILQVDWYEDAETAQTGGSIGASAFENCSALREIGIPEHVASIGDAAFKACALLDQQDGELSFSENMGALGTQAFYGCTKIRTMSFYGTDPAIGSGALPANSELTVEAPESAADLKACCRDAGLKFVSLEGIGDTQIQGEAYVTLAKSSITVKAGKSKKIAYRTNGKVKKIKASGTNGKVSVTKSGRKVKFTGRSAASGRSVKLNFDMKKARDVSKSVSVTVKKASSGLDGFVGEEQIFKPGKSSVTFTSDAAASQKVKITRSEGAEGALHCTPSKKAIVKYTMKADGTLQITPVKAGKVTLTVWAEADEVFEASEPARITVTVKARPAKVTAKVKKLSKTKARVSWKKIYGVKSYQIQVSTSKGFKSKKTYTAKSSALKKVVKIKKGKKNYIRVRYKLKSGKAGKWSTTLVVKK